MVREVFFFIFCLLPLDAATFFIFGNGGSGDSCYRYELDECFRTAFVRMMTNSDRRVRNIPLLHNLNVSALDRGRLGVQHVIMCHDVRSFSTCFSFPGCTDQSAAQVAANQYHMVFGKMLPVQTFLAFRGYGKQMCEHSCSREALFACRRELRSAEEKEEQNDARSLLQDAVAIAEGIGRTEDAITLCDKFRRTLMQLIRARSEYCGEAAKCTCMEDELQRGISFCNAGCEHLMQESEDELLNPSLSRSPALLFLISITFSPFPRCQLINSIIQ